jgi:hypothetical protein
VQCSLMSSMHEEVKFIRYFCVTAQKLDLKKKIYKITIIKAFAMNYNVNRCLERSQCHISYPLRVGL